MGRKIQQSIYLCPWQAVKQRECSLGAFFSLHAYRDRYFENCLFQSPILNMEYLIQQMFMWFHITEEQLREQGKIPTPVETMSWLYYRYVKEHPIDRWTVPTYILYGAKDNLQSLSVINDFGNKFNSHITIAEKSEHPFMEESDGIIVSKWMNNYIR